MKLFSLLLSVVVFFVAFVFFVVKVPDVESLNDIIYISLLITLMAICVVGVIINWEFFTKRKYAKDKGMIFVNNSYSKKDKN